MMKSKRYSQHKPRLSRFVLPFFIIFTANAKFYFKNDLLAYQKNDIEVFPIKGENLKYIAQNISKSDSDYSTFEYLKYFMILERKKTPFSKKDFTRIEQISKEKQNLGEQEFLKYFLRPAIDLISPITTISFGALLERNSCYTQHFGETKYYFSKKHSAEGTYKKFFKGHDRHRRPIAVLVFQNQKIDYQSESTRTELEILRKGVNQKGIVQLLNLGEGTITQNGIHFPSILMYQNFYLSFDQFPGKIIEKNRLQGMLSVFQGLKWLHTLEWVHTDIKPENLMISLENGKFQILLADFGLATKKGNRRERYTGGTPMWSAPEILMHEYYDDLTFQKVQFQIPSKITFENGISNDIYALATSLLEIFIGDPQRLSLFQKGIQLTEELGCFQTISRKLSLERYAQSLSNETPENINYICATSGQLLKRAIHPYHQKRISTDQMIDNLMKEIK